MIALGVTNHLEGPRDAASAGVYEAVAAQTRRADALGFDYAWFSEHHAHAHFGHLPAPLLLATHLAGQTRRIRLGTAILCLNLHHPLAVAEQVAVADALAGGRLAPGFGSGSTPEEFRLFGQPETAEATRHARFAEALRVIRLAWAGRIGPGDAAGFRHFAVPACEPLPVAAAGLVGRSWVAVNSVGAAAVAGQAGMNVLFSHLRTPAQYNQYAAAYHAAGGRGLVAANRPVYVGADDAAAWAEVEPALRRLWRRFRAEGKIPPDTPEPADPRALAGHPINFLVGGPERVARGLAELHAEAPYEVANLEVDWAGLSAARVHACLKRLAEQVRPRLAELLGEERAEGAEARGRPP